MFFLFFLISGFCGVLYQIVWLRLAMAEFGVIAPVLSVVLSVFMLGMGLGSWASGRWLNRPGARRLPPGRLLALYGSCEALAALGALSVPALFTAGAAQLTGGMDNIGYLWRSALVIGGTLLVPCLALGATTPMALAVFRAAGRDTRRSFSGLYFANVLGALIAAVATPYALIELLGFHRTLSLGIGLQAVIAAGALALSLRSSAPAVAAVSESARPAVDPLFRRAALPALFATGFVSMACEVVWTRLFTTVLGTTIYAFAGILAVYLACHALGVALYRLYGRRAGSRVTIGALTVLPIATVWPLFMNDSRWPLSPVRALTSLALFCGLLGWLTPGWVDAYSAGDPRTAGRAYAVNVFGCVLGPLAAAYVLLTHIGVKGSLIVLGWALAILPLWILWRRAVGVAVGLSVASAGIVAASGAMSSLEVPAFLTHPQVRRDYAATVVSAGEGMGKMLVVNGICLTSLTPLTKIMAHLPLLAHTGAPRRALMICFGMGTTYRSLLSWGLQTTAVELVPSVRDAFGYYFADAADVLRRPEGHIVIDDGRRYLKRTSDQYDLITLDPPPPSECAASGLLYSREFYTDIKRHLAPDGVVQQWWPGGELAILQSVARTFVEAFPYVRVYQGMGMGFHFLGSRVPLRPLGPADVKRLPPAAVRDLMEWFPGMTVQDVWKDVLRKEIPAMALVDPGVPALTDDAPYNEYFLLRRWRARRKGRNYMVR